MFVSSQRFRSNPKLFIYDKPLPMGSISERDVTPVLDCCDNPTGSGAYKNFFEMSQEEEIVSHGTVCAKLTPAQNSLLELLHGPEAKDYADSLKNIHVLGSYFAPEGMECPRDSYYTHRLLDAITDLSLEHFTLTHKINLK